MYNVYKYFIMLFWHEVLLLLKFVLEFLKFMQISQKLGLKHLFSKNKSVLHDFQLLYRAE